jgi:FixJ family two-component response regulator
MDQPTDSSKRRAAVCLIQQNSSIRKQRLSLLAHLDSPVLCFQTPHEFLEHCAYLNIACILIDGDELGSNAKPFFSELSRLGLAQAAMVLASQADIDDAVIATQNGIADYVETPQPDRLLLTRIREVMGTDGDRPPDEITELKADAKP